MAHVIWTSNKTSKGLCYIQIRENATRENILHSARQWQTQYRRYFLKRGKRCQTIHQNEKHNCNTTLSTKKNGLLWCRNKLQYNLIKHQMYPNKKIKWALTHQPHSHIMEICSKELQSIRVKFKATNPQIIPTWQNQIFPTSVNLGYAEIYSRNLQNPM